MNFDDLIPTKSAPKADLNFEDLIPEVKKPTRGLSDYPRDVAAAGLKIGPVFLEGLGNLAQLATGGKVGSGLSESMARGKSVIDQLIGSEALNAEKQAIAQVLADPNKGAMDVVRALPQNPGAVVDMGVSTVGSMLLPLGAVGLAGKVAPIGAKAATGIAVGTGAAQNAAETFTQTEGDLSDKYKAAAISGAISAALGKALGGGVEGQIARQMTGSGAGVAGAKGVAKSVLKESGQEFGEESGNVLAQNVGEGAPIDTNAMLKQGTLGGVLGALVSGPVSVNQMYQQRNAPPPETSSPEAIGKILEALGQTQEAQQAAATIPALPYDPTVQNVQTLIADTQGNVRPEDSAEAFYRQQKAQQDAEMGLTPDVRKAQEARQMSADEFLDAPQAEPEMLQMLRRAGWRPQQEVFNQKPDLAPEQAQQLERALAEDVQAEFNNDLKAEIRGRLGLERRAEDPAPESYAQNPLLRLIANEGGINIDERSDFDVDPKRLTKNGRTMPAPYNIAGKPLFRQGGLQGDMLVEKLQQAGYLTQEQIDLADANRPGGSYQLAYDLVSRAIQDPQSVGLDAQDAPTRRAQTAQAKQLEADASRLGIETRGMDERQIANQINRVQRRAEKPATPDFQTRKMARIEDAETARGRAMAEKLDRLERIAAVRDLDEREQAAFAQIFFEDDGTPYIAKRTEIEQNEAYDEYYSALETTPARTDLEGDQGLAAREPQEGSGSGTRSSANAEPRSAGTGTETGQDGDQTLTSYTEEEVRQREQRAAEQARKQERDRIEQERRAEADAQRNDFTLTGSDRTADQAAARGQNALFTVDVKAEKPTHYVDASRIEPVNPVTAPEKYDYLVKRFSETKKFNGEPVLAWRPNKDRNDWNAVTGSHRIMAAGDAGIKVPVIEIPDAAFKFEDSKGRSLEELIGYGDDEVADFLREAADAKFIPERIAKIMEQEAARNRGDFILQSQPSRTLSNFRKLTGDHSASTAKADAEQMLGIDSPVPVLTKNAPELAQGKTRVPMWYDLDEKVIYYNTAFKERDRAQDAQWMTEEIMHAIDHVGGRNTLSLSGGRFNEGGDIRQEIERAMPKSGIIRDMLRYPLEYDFADDRKAVELFARLGVLFKGFPDSLRAAAPKTFKVYDDIFKSLSAVPETVSGRLPGERGETRERLDDVGRGRGQADAGNAREQADQRLGQLRDAIVGATQGDRGGRAGDFGSASLEARATDDIALTYPGAKQNTSPPGGSSNGDGKPKTTKPVQPEKTKSSKDALGRRKFVLGEVAFHKLEAASKPLLDRFSMSAASPELRRQLRSMKATIESAKVKAGNVAKEMSAMKEADRIMVSDIMEKMLAPGVIPPEHALKVADSITRTMDQQTNELVELGMLSKETADRWRGKYLPRIYNRKTELEGESLFMRLFKSGTPAMRGIGGGSLKGRGLFEEIDVSSLDQWLGMGYEVRDPRWKFKDNKLELTDPNTPKRFQDRVTVWRDWTADERAKMGENRDSLYRFVQGYTSMQRDIALGRLFDNISKNPEWVRNSVADGWVQVPNTEIPDTGGVKRFGNLAGLYVKNEVMAHLSQYEKTAGDAMQIYREAMGIWKEGKTALNPVAHFNNIASNLSMAHFAGVSYWDGGKYVNAIRDLKNDSPMVDEAREAGLFTGSFTKEEMLQSLPPELQRLVEQDDGKVRQSGRTIMKWLTLGMRKPLQDAYEFEDTFFKYLIYRDARQQGLSPEDATDYALRYIFTYDDLPAGAKFIRDTALPFFGWTYKAVPALLHTAMVYPWRLVAPAFFLHSINTIAYAIAAGDEDDDWIKKISKGFELEKQERKVLPERMEGNSALGTPKTIRLGTDSVTGHPVYLDVSRVIPGGDLFDMTNQAGGMPWPTPLTPNSPVISTFSAMILNKEMFFGRDIVDKNDTGLEAAEKRAKWMAGLLLPAIAPGGYHSQRLLDAAANAADTVIETPLGDFTGVGRDGLPVQPKYAAMQTFGVKARPVDLELEEQRKAAQDVALVRSIAAEVRSLARLHQKGAVSDRMMEQAGEKAREKIQRNAEEDE